MEHPSFSGRYADDAGPSAAKPVEFRRGHDGDVEGSRNAAKHPANGGAPFGGRHLVLPYNEEIDITVVPAFAPGPRTKEDKLPWLERRHDPSRDLAEQLGLFHLRVSLRFYQQASERTRLSACSLFEE